MVAADRGMADELGYSMVLARYYNVVRFGDAGRLGGDSGGRAT